MGVGLSKVEMWGLFQAKKKDTKARVKDSSPHINLLWLNPSSLSRSQQMESPWDVGSSQRMESPWDVGINLAVPILPPSCGC